MKLGALTRFSLIVPLLMVPPTILMDGCATEKPALQAPKPPPPPPPVKKIKLKSKRPSGFMITIS